MQTTSYLFAGDNAEIVPSDDPTISKAYAGQAVQETVVYPTAGGVNPEGNQVTFVAEPLGADGATVLVEHSYDDPFIKAEADASWLPNAELPATVVTAAAPFQGNYYLGVRAIRFTVTGGAAKISVVQNA